MARELCYDNLSLVERYLKHKLAKHGVVCKSLSSAEEDDNSDRRRSGNSLECARSRRVRLHRALRGAGDEMERTYKQELEEMSAQMISNASTAQRSFLAVAEELFGDGVNWGRIVAFFELGGALCVESVKQETEPRAENVARWMSDYLNGPLQSWIRDNGGWDAFAELYSRQMDPALSRCTAVLGLAALGLAGLTIGALFSQK